MKMCPLTRSAEQTAGAKCSESCEWWMSVQQSCAIRQIALSITFEKEDEDLVLPVSGPALVDDSSDELEEGDDDAD